MLHLQAKPAKQPPTLPVSSSVLHFLTLCYSLSTMATRIGPASRQLAFRRFSSGGKILSEEEKAAENVYIKKVEKEKLEKLAHKGPKPEETTASGSGGASTDIKASSAASPTPPGVSTEKVSSDKYRNYAVVAGTVTVFGALGWYLKSGGKKQEEVRD